LPFATVGSDGQIIAKIGFFLLNWQFGLDKFDNCWYDLAVLNFYEKRNGILGKGKGCTSPLKRTNKLSFFVNC